MRSDTLRKFCLTREDAIDFLAGRLPTDREIEIDNHLRQCPECSDRIDQLSDDSALREALRAHQHCPDSLDLPATLSEFREGLYALSDSAVSGILGVSSGVLSNSASSGNFQIDSPQALQPANCPERLDRFEIVRPLGRGGFGMVYLANDPRLHRQVALKIPRLAMLDDPQHRARFLREGRATAGLYHSHILPVYEAGEIDGLCYLTSMYCSGPTLAEWLREQAGPITSRQAAHIVAVLADALEHAHQNGVLHRDVKPGNVLLDTTRVCGPLPFTPLLADFGLAKLVDADVTVTDSNTLMGTPRYMAPEQASGRSRDVGPATDVYSLGAVLYELITATVPIEGGDNADTLCRLLTDLPVAPRRLVPSIPRDLEAICLKCLEKSPEHRYATAAKLAADLRRFLDGTPTRARPMPVFVRAWRWTGRHPGAASVLLTLAIATAVVWALVLAHSHRISIANAHLQSTNQRYRESRRQAEQSAQRAREFLYATDMSLADLAGRQGDVKQMLTLLNRHRPVPGEPDTRGFEWNLLYRSAQMKQRTLLSLQGDIYQIRFSADGRLFAAACKNGQVQICDGRTFQTRRVLNTGQGEVNGIGFSPDGGELATAGEDGTVRVWNVATGVERLKIDVFTEGHQAYNVLFTPDGQRLVVCGQNPVIRLWNRKTGQAAGSLKGHQYDVESLAISQDGHLLCSVSEDQTARLWNLDLNKISFVLAPREMRLGSVAISPDGRWMADGSTSGEVYIGDVLSQKDITEPLLHFDAVHSLAFSPDSKLLATGDRAGVVRLWKVADHLRTHPRGPTRTGNTPLRFWTAHSGRVWSLAFSHDGTELITGGGDGLVKAWSLKNLAEDNHLRAGRHELLHDFSFLSSGVLVTAGNKGVATWDLATRKRIGGFSPSQENHWVAVSVSGNRRWMAAGGKTGMVRLWDTVTGALVAEWNPENHISIRDVELTFDGKLLAVRSTDNLWVFEVPAFRLLTRFPSEYVNVIAFSPDGRQLAFKNDSSAFKNDSYDTIGIWNVADQREIRILSGHRGTVSTLAYSLDGRLLASGGDDRLVRLWSLDREAPPVVLTGNRGRLVSLSFSPDSRSLLTIDRSLTPGDQTRTLKVWNLTTRQEILSRTHNNCFRAALSPDSRSLVIRETRGKIRVIDVSPPQDDSFP